MQDPFDSTTFASAFQATMKVIILTVLLLLAMSEGRWAPAAANSRQTEQDLEPEMQTAKSYFRLPMRLSSGLTDEEALEDELLNGKIVKTIPEVWAYDPMYRG